MALNIKVQGNHIQHILQKILAISVVGGYTGKRDKEDEYLTYELTDDVVSTNQSERIDIHHFWDYPLIIKNNLFTFAIVNRFDVVNHIIKLLTDEQQIRILSYLGATTTLLKKLI